MRWAWRLIAVIVLAVLIAAGWLSFGSRLFGLAPLTPASVTFTFVVEGGGSARVYIDGRDLGTTPLTLTLLELSAVLREELGPPVTLAGYRGVTHAHEKDGHAFVVGVASAAEAGEGERIEEDTLVVRAMINNEESNGLAAIRVVRSDGRVAEYSRTDLKYQYSRSHSEVAFELTFAWP